MDLFSLNQEINKKNRMSNLDFHHLDEVKQSEERQLFYYKVTTYVSLSHSQFSISFSISS